VTINGRASAILGVGVERRRSGFDRPLVVVRQSWVTEKVRSRLFGTRSNRRFVLQRIAEN
jgi:hypothetical protein